MEEREEIHVVLDSVDQNTDAAANIILKRERHQHLIRWLVETALIHLKAQARAQRRRQLRREIEPGYQVMLNGGKRLELTESAKQRLKAATKKLFGRDGWQIGDVNIGDFTKESLIEEAERERRLAKGHTRNAEFYEALAAPMKAGQFVRDYWTPERVADLRNSRKEKSERL